MKKLKMNNVLKILNNFYFKVFISFILTFISVFSIVCCFVYNERVDFKIKNDSNDLYISSIRIGNSNYPLKQFESKHIKFKNDKLIVEKGHYFNKEYAKNLNIYVDYSTKIGDEITIKNGTEKNSFVVKEKNNTYNPEYNFKSGFIEFVHNIKLKQIGILLLMFLLNSFIFYFIINYIINFYKKIYDTEKSSFLDILKFELSIIYIYLFCLFSLLKVFGLFTLIPLLVFGIIPIIYLREKINKILPEIFIIIATIFGLFMTFALPLFHVPDEASHYFKAYSIVDSKNVFTNDSFRVGKAMINLPSSSGRILDKYNMDIFNSGYKISANEFFADMAVKVNETGKKEMFYFGNTYDLNSFCYLPSALIIFICIKLSSPFIITVLFCRIINMLLFLAGGYFAIKIVPKFKKIFLIVMLLPLTLHQAGAINQDSLTNTLFFLIAAVLIKMYFSKKNSISNKDLIFLFFISMFLGFCKTGYFPILFLILFIPNSKFKTKRQMLISKGMILLPCLLLSFSKYFQVGSVTLAADVNYYKFSDLITHPFMIIKVAINTFFYRGSLDLLTGLVDGFGWSTRWHNPLIAFICTSLYLLLILTSCEEKKHDYKFKILSFIISMMIFGLIYVSLLFGWTNFGSEFIDGLQCRYFIPVVLMLYISLSNNCVKLNFKNKDLVYVSMIVIVEILSLFTIILGYYR